MRLLVKTLYGLEEVLAAELTALGAENVQVLNRAVAFERVQSQCCIQSITTAGWHSLSCCL